MPTPKFWHWRDQFYRIESRVSGTTIFIVKKYVFQIKSKPKTIPGLRNNNISAIDGSFW
jgi:hypothetical protein